MRSMTGFGRGYAEKDNVKVTVEIKTVNHKQLDLSVKAPRTVFFCEDAIRKICKKNITRGHADVFVNFADEREGRRQLSVDVALAEQYLSAAKKLCDIGIKDDLTVSQIMRMPDVITSESEDDESLTEELVALATGEACRNLVAAREKEGDALRTELIFRLRNLSEIVGEIDERAPAVGESYAKKLRQRIEEYLGGIDVDESRFLTEVACFVDRSNIDEEITRLKTHIKHGFSLMDESGEVGKKLDFLVQEINREINTTGSKSNDIEITQKVLAAKNELEKFREQVQNIE